MSLDQTVSELRDEITQLRRMMFIAASGVLVMLMFSNFWIAFSIWQFETIFQDTLGSRDKLPEMTHLVINYGHAANGLMPFAMVISGTAIAWSLMMRSRHNARFMLIAVIAIFLLLAHYFIISFALNFPMHQLIGPIMKA